MSSTFIISASRIFTWRWLLVAVLLSGIKCDVIDEDVALLGTPYRYDLTQIKTSDGEVYTETKSDEKSSTKVISTATNSPIFYINQLDFSSLFHNFIKPPAAFQSPFAFGGLRQPQNSRPSSANKNKKRRKRPSSTSRFTMSSTAISTTTTTPTTTTSTLPPVAVTKPPSNWPLPTSTIQMIPLPFVSNAKPIGYYKLKWTSPNIKRFTTKSTTTTSTEAPTTFTTTEPVPSTTTSEWTTTKATIPTTTTTFRPPPNSKIIRLKTKFLANGKPSSVFMHNSPHRRYSLKDLMASRKSFFAVTDESKRKPQSHRNRQNYQYRPANEFRQPQYQVKKNINSYSGNRKWWLSK